MDDTNPNKDGNSQTDNGSATISISWPKPEEVKK